MSPPPRALLSSLPPSPSGSHPRPQAPILASDAPHAPVPWLLPTPCPEPTLKKGPRLAQNRVNNGGKDRVLRAACSRWTQRERVLRCHSAAPAKKNRQAEAARH